MEKRDQDDAKAAAAETSDPQKGKQILAEAEQRNKQDETIIRNLLKDGDVRAELANHFRKQAAEYTDDLKKRVDKLMPPPEKAMDVQSLSM